MAEPFKVRRIVHVIHAVNDYHATRVRYMNVFGALVFAEGYHPEADRDMNLFYVGDFMIEPMAPRRTASKLGKAEGPAAMAQIYADYLDRFGEGWHSFEVAVDNLPQVVEDLKARGIRVSPGVPFTHPRDSFGLCIEMFTSDGKMPNDPFNYKGWNPKWHAGNPLTLEGIAAIVHSVRDLPGARDFLVGTWGAQVLNQDTVTSPEPLERCLLELAGVRFLLVKPTGMSGPLTESIQKRNLGIYSLAWKVGSIADAKARLAQLKVQTEEGTSVMGGICISPADMFGARHELVERV